MSNPPLRTNWVEHIASIGALTAASGWSAVFVGDTSWWTEPLLAWAVVTTDERLFIDGNDTGDKRCDDTSIHGFVSSEMGAESAQFRRDCFAFYVPDSMTEADIRSRMKAYGASNYKDDMPRET